MGAGVNDAHRHLGALPDFAFYGGPPVNAAPDVPTTVTDLIRRMDAEGTDRCLVIPNYGVPDPEVAFSHNELVVEAAATDERIRAALWVSPLERDVERNEKAFALAGERGVKALKMSFLLGGSVDDPACTPQIERVMALAAQHDLTVHVHTSPGAQSDIDVVGKLVDTYADTTKIHLVHFGGGMSGHIKLCGGRFLDWVESGKRVYTDVSWAIGFAPRWLVGEIEKRGVGHDRVLFASDEPWSDRPSEIAKLQAATGDGELHRRFFASTWDELYA